VVDELRPTAESAITVNTLGNLHGDWDVGRLQQVLSNLLANALCHGNPAGVVTLTLDGSQSDTVCICIHNEGTIPRGVRATMFEPFSGTATLRRRAKRDAPAGGAPANGGQDGLGLGLYIASEIVRAHGGTIEVHSSEGEGTSFDIRLPRGKHSITA
jgi:signal transduction histidine kinase